MSLESSEFGDKAPMLSKKNLAIEFGIATNAFILEFISSNCATHAKV